MPSTPVKKHRRDHSWVNTNNNTSWFESTGSWSFYLALVVGAWLIFCAFVDPFLAISLTARTCTAQRAATRNVGTHSGTGCWVRLVVRPGGAPRSLRLRPSCLPPSRCSCTSSSRSISSTGTRGLQLPLTRARTTCRPSGNRSVTDLAPQSRCSCAKREKRAPNCLRDLSAFSPAKRTRFHEAVAGWPPSACSGDPARVPAGRSERSAL